MKLLSALTVSVLLSLAVVSGVAHRAPAPDQPYPDTQYVYDQINFMSSNYLMRYSGFDGPPGDLSPQDGNAPPQTNGWQEFYQHWHQQMVSPTVMGSFSRFVHYQDHLFWSLGKGVTPYQSNVASVTIPGAACPGQVALVAGHPDSTPGANTGNGSTYDDTSGVVMGIGELSALTRWWEQSGTWPTRTIKVALFDAEETGLNGSAYYASHLIPPGPQGSYILVANMDQNGLEYPAYPAGTTQTTFGPHPWYTNVNASPMHFPNSIYTGAAQKAIQSNMAAVVHFRSALAQEVSIAFQEQGEKYGFSLPLENPIEGGRSVPAYHQSDIALYSPVQDDTLGRTDQVPFIQLGIPGYGLVGAYDSNAQDNPTATAPGPLTPIGASGIPQIAGYDTPRDNIIHYNLMTSGTDGGGFAGPGSVAVKRALELPMTWTLGLLARPEYVGGSAYPSGPVAYFESFPEDPAVGSSVSFDARGSADLIGKGLSYAWDFGDGKKATGPAPQHTYLKVGWYDAKLVVTDAKGESSGYRVSVKVGSARGSAIHADPCGKLSPTEIAAVLGHRVSTPIVLGVHRTSSRTLPATGVGDQPWFAATLLLVAAVMLRRLRRAS
ncbi:MAG TPA: PKD domain-containing protein [Actinomycetota bacterium]|nr:PKD domain-containing protein [Actinomycetota bacterium]